MFDASILIATHRRNHVLKWNLDSLARQGNNVEVIVLDDCYISDPECVALVDSFKNRLHVRYVHSGASKKGKDIWRVPGYAYNIGARLAEADIVIVSCGEMYHYGNTTKFIIDSIKKDRWLQCTVGGLDDKHGSFLSTLNAGGEITLEHCQRMRNTPLHAPLPFFLGVAKERYFAIGGYDESFTGMAYEDNDFIERLERSGVHSSHRLERMPIGFVAQIPVPENIWMIHLQTPHVGAAGPNKERHDLNRSIYESNKAKSVVVANTNIEWGKL